MSVFTLNAETRQDILLERRLSLLSSFNGGGSSNGVVFFFNSGQKTLPDRITNRISGECCTGCLQFALVLKKDGGVFFIITTRARTAQRKFELFQNHRVVYNIPTFSFKRNKEVVDLEIVFAIRRFWFHSMFTVLPLRRWLSQQSKCIQCMLFRKRKIFIVLYTNTGCQVKREVSASRSVVSRCLFLEISLFG